MLTGCVYLPQTTSHYNPDCQIEERHMTLEQYQMASFAGCNNQDCVTLLVVVGVVSAASVVVSGSVVVTGNVVYWLEEQASCITPQKQVE